MSIARPARGWTFTTAVPHPGEILREEFLVPHRISMNRLAQGLHVTAGRISDIVNGRRGITADTALRLSVFFGTTPEFWINLQTTYDLSKEQAEHMSEIERDVHRYATAT
ncbi:MAG TPA: HigA family addiction module antitoxin [Acidobacteriaceae bacterium]|jgi:addiction module HigA family antidote|nr:HigA family addiction module antitoxin [Acidobacteriaceae bacterium]